MRTLIICLTICAVAFLSFSEYRRVEERKLRAAEELALKVAAADAAAKQAIAAQTPRPGTQSRPLVVEIRKPTLRSVGLNANGPAPSPVPAKDDKIKSAWGFGKTALDESPRR